MCSCSLAAFSIQVEAINKFITSMDVAIMKFGNARMQREIQSLEKVVINWLANPELNSSEPFGPGITAEIKSAVQANGKVVSVCQTLQTHLEELRGYCEIKGLAEQQEFEATDCVKNAEKALTDARFSLLLTAGLGAIVYSNAATASQTIADRREGRVSFPKAPPCAADPKWPRRPRWRR